MAWAKIWEESSFIKWIKNPRSGKKELVMEEKFILKQKVSLITNINTWIDIATFARESDAWEAFDKAKEKNKNSVIAVFKITEDILI